ncbi:hypothetical protein BpHYR1_031145 [Brachionus plicatilis]|uniref:Uncharacterized protein n=1 Tax=Brachionus plicatilis TaxID=10195 RepID=A0A3M7SDV0_BRAPC|nr:hypothetical protein BpHYR1_031145 [Brachionus plicatilis]
MNSDDKKSILNLSNKIAELNQSKEVDFEEYLEILEQNQLKCKQNKIIEHLLIKLLKVFCY